MEELFDVCNNPQLNKSAFVFSEKGQYPYFTRTVTNNGILGYVEYLDDSHKIPGNSLAVGMLGMKFFYMRSDFYAGQFTKTIFPKFDLFNEKIALYFISILNKCSKKFLSVLVRDFEKTFNDTEVVLPYKNQNISFEYMEQYVRELEAERVRELEAERVRELEAYLLASGLNDYQLTDNEKEILSGKVKCKFKMFKIGDLFEKLEISSNKSIDKRKDVSTSKTSEFDLPLVNAKHGDNGIMFYGRSSDWIIAENVIDVVQNGAVATGDVYPQPHKCSVLWDAYLLKLKDYEPTDNILFYLSSALQKSIKLKFSYDNKAIWKKVRLEEVFLPCGKDDKPDFSYIDAYISALKKLVIRDVVAWKDKEINAYKAIVDN